MTQQEKRAAIFLKKQEKRNELMSGVKESLPSIRPTVPEPSEPAPPNPAPNIKQSPNTNQLPSTPSNMFDENTEFEQLTIDDTVSDYTPNYRSTDQLLNGANIPNEIDTNTYKKYYLKRMKERKERELAKQKEEFRKTTIQIADQRICQKWTHRTCDGCPLRRPHFKNSCFIKDCLLKED